MQEMCAEMVAHDIDQARQKVFVKSTWLPRISGKRTRYDNCIFVAGHKGMVGSAIVRQLSGPCRAAIGVSIRLI